MDSMCITDSMEGLTGSGSTFLTTPGKMDYCEGLAPPDANASWGAFTSALPTTWGAADQCEGQDDADMSASAAPPLLLTTVTMPSPLLEGQPPQPILSAAPDASGLNQPADGKPLRHKRKKPKVRNPLPDRVKLPERRALTDEPRDNPKDERPAVVKLIIASNLGVDAEDVGAYLGVKDPNGERIADVLGGKSESCDRAVGDAARNPTCSDSAFAQYCALLKTEPTEDLRATFEEQAVFARIIVLKAFGANASQTQFTDAATLARECREELPRSVCQHTFWEGLQIFRTEVTQTRASKRWRILFAEWTGPRGVLRNGASAAMPEIGWYRFSAIKGRNGAPAEMTANFWVSGAIVPK